MTLYEYTCYDLTGYKILVVDKKLIFFLWRQVGKSNLA